MGLIFSAVYFKSKAFWQLCHASEAHGYITAEPLLYTQLYLFTVHKHYTTQQMFVQRKSPSASCLSETGTGSSMISNSEGV